MGLPKVNNCCFALNLKIGSILIGVFLIIHAVILLLLFFGVFTIDNYGFDGYPVEKLGLLLEGVASLITGVCIFYAIIQSDYRFLKIPAVFLFVIQCVVLPAFLLSLLHTITGITLLLFVLLSAAKLYFVFVLWNFAEELGGVELV